MGERWWEGEKIRLGSASEQLRDYIEGLETASIRMDNRIEQLETELLNARREALEEAERVCDEHEKANLYGVKECAAAIRALKEKE
jgi:hypothetical protein